MAQNIWKIRQKTRTGGESRNIRAVEPKAFSVANASPERNLVFVYKVYSEKRPSLMKVSEAHHIDYIKSPSMSNKRWFKSGAMGANKLNSWMKTMAEKAGHRRLTNHSTRTSDAKIERPHNPSNVYYAIIWLRNVQSVTNYSTISNEQQKNMFLILSENKASTGNVQAASFQSAVVKCESSFMKSSSSVFVPGAFSEAVFHRGHFNITINNLN